MTTNAQFLPFSSSLQPWGGMEFSTFRLQPGVTEAQLRVAVDEMVAGLYADEPGFLGHALLRGADGVYVDVVFADSMERARALCAKWGSGPFAPACMAYLAAICPGSANLGFFERL